MCSEMKGVNVSSVTGVIAENVIYVKNCKNSISRFKVNMNPLKNMKNSQNLKGDANSLMENHI